MPQRWRPFSPQSSLPHTFCRRPCSSLTTGVLPLACLLTKEPFPSRLVEDLPPTYIPLIPSISSLVPRNSSQVLAHHHMAMICPPYFMMHICYPWRNYRQVPSASFSNISVHVQLTDKLRSDEKGLGVRQSMSITDLQCFLPQLSRTIFIEFSKAGLLKSALKMTLNHNNKNTSPGPPCLHTMWLAGVLPNHSGRLVLNVCLQLRAHSPHGISFHCEIWSVTGNSTHLHTHLPLAVNPAFEIPTLPWFWEWTYSNKREFLSFDPWCAKS